jgi:hypothetical protein
MAYLVGDRQRENLGERLAVFASYTHYLVVEQR